MKQHVEEETQHEADWFTLSLEARGALPQVLMRAQPGAAGAVELRCTSYVALANALGADPYVFGRALNELIVGGWLSYDAARGVLQATPKSLVELERFGARWARMIEG